ncbi:MAG TPA: hypothetical protein VKY27_00800 [Bacteriovoracaceae bacterium]|nr:hypothetical protein [Bacteriovoracaceae bacterium]
MVTYRGINIYLKDNQSYSVLRDLMQIHKTQCPKGPFAFIASDSLLPNLSLWENLHIVTGGLNWQEVLSSAGREEQSLMRLIKNPNLPTSEAHNWEKFIISLLKGLKTRGNLLIDMREEELNPMMVQLFKKIFVRVQRNIIIASESASLWLDCSHRIYSKKDYEIHVEELNPELVKKHWAA